MAGTMFYDHMTGELTELGKRYGFPENSENHPTQYEEALLRYNNDMESDKTLIEEVPDNEAMFEEIDGGKYEILAEDDMYERATSQCEVLRPVLQNSQCSDETRKSVIGIIKNILGLFYDTDEIKKRKEQIFLENPDFFPKEAAIVRAKRNLVPHLEQLKARIQNQQSKKIKPEDRISGTVASDRLVEGIERGIIAKPKDTRAANRQAMQIRRNLGLMLEKQSNKF
ncbi:MAG: hypothetical protein J6Y07_04105 [Alphaproteobacteria bacterium]|nr:hypothetical protein [Alphaproteobacteria bacterium]